MDGIYFLIVGLSQGPVMRWFSMSVHCPFRGHISKTNQDRPIVTMEQYTEAAPLILLLHSDPPDAPLGRYSGFRPKYKICSNISTASCSTWHQTTAAVNTAQPSIVTPQLSTVVNRVRPSESVGNNHRRLH